MKRFYKKVFKSKKPSRSTHGTGPLAATSTLTDSTLITSAGGLMPSFPACDSDATASAQVTGAGVSVSLQLRPSHLEVLTDCYRLDRS